MSTHAFAKGFNGFSGFLHNFVLANLAVSSIGVNPFLTGAPKNTLTILVVANLANMK